MADSLPLRFKGAPGSPYTRKMLAVLRYRRLPYEFLIGDQATDLGLPEPKVALLPTFYLPGDDGKLRAVVDSTPLIRRFEDEFPGRSVVPADPVLAFLDYLLEDYADEWLTKAMFHYRWYFQADIDKAGTILPIWRGISEPAEKLARAKQFISERQIQRLYVVGSNDVTAPVIEDSYRRFLALFDAVLQHQPFLFGHRPASADFGVYAQLTQLAKFDPTPAAICLEEAPRVHAWTDLVDDLSGNPAADDAWMARDRAAEVLGGLLEEVGRVYVPALVANAAAMAAGEDAFETTIDGCRWTQPSFPYQAKCLAWIRARFQALDGADREAVRSLLEGTGCEPLMEPGA
ncbi:MAG: glutathione S-transferase [Gammaproteobacteria bacterium]|nr:glutathione S-transferase [Gammaproteobacteria bacterium]MBK81405.1 glutathione S-transferase [Gammaproteobacteria bacterium]